MYIYMELRNSIPCLALAAEILRPQPIQQAQAQLLLTTAQTLLPKAALHPELFIPDLELCWAYSYEH